MSIKFQEFIKYSLESSGICLRNILPIICVSALMLAFIVVVSGIVGYGLLLILQSESVSTGLSIDFSNATTMVLASASAFLVLLINIALYSSVISIYAFYITFKSEDENYRLFFALIKEHLWKIIKISLIAWSRILIGTLFFIIPGMVLAIRYAAINYFVILENTNFTSAKAKSAEVMNGFKIIIFLFLSIISILSSFGNSSVDGINNGEVNIILYLGLFLLQRMFAILYSIIIYTICKNEAYKNVIVSDAPQTYTTPEAIAADSTIVNTAHVAISDVSHPSLASEQKPELPL